MENYFQENGKYKKKAQNYNQRNREKLPKSPLKYYRNISQNEKF